MQGIEGMLGLKKVHYYVISLLSALLIPLALDLTSAVFSFAVLLTLLVWFSARWQQLNSTLTSTSSRWEVSLGAIVFIANIIRNLTIHPISLGLFDMLVAFMTLSVIFYGFNGLKRLWIPAVYLGVLIVTYQLEFVAEEVQTLETALAQMMIFTMNSLGIKAILSNPVNVVQIFTPYGPYLLQIDGPCTGVKGMLAYGSLAVLMLLDEKASVRRKLAISAIGIAGTFVVNLLRLNVIFLVIYGLGIDAGLFVHSYLGYTLFIVWMVVFWSVAYKYLIPSLRVGYESQGVLHHQAPTFPNFAEENPK